MLDHVDIGWSWLKDHLDRVIDEVNQNKPLASSSIAVSESTTGSLLTLIRSSETAASAPTDDPWRITPDGQTASWHTMTVKISDGHGGCTDGWFWYWGTLTVAGLPPAPQ